MSHVSLASRLACLALVLAGLMILMPSSFTGSHASSDESANDGRAKAKGYSVAGGGENPSSAKAPAEPDREQGARIGEAYGNLPLSFEANRGQADPQVKFISRGSGYSLFLTSTEAVLALSRPAAPQGERHSAETRQMPDAPQAASSSAVLRMKLAGANPQSQVSGIEPQPGKTNYFIGNDRNQWRTDVQNYAQVRYESVYPGIDLIYYGNQRQLEFDFRVAPGANPNQIRMAFAGADGIFIDKDGDLVLHTADGDVRQHKPLLYQEANGVRREISGRYVMKGRRQVGFEVGAYDRSRALVIDPVLVYSTYMGGTRTDRGYSIAVDSSGNAYVTGITYSSNFPTLNPPQAALAGETDAFVVKLNPAGTALVYATYLGGSAGEAAYGITVDGSGNAYVTGYTGSSNFPTVNAPQSVYKGGGDLFVAKLNAAGSALTYSTYWGGVGFERGRGIAVDPAGNAYITGSTESADFTVVNALQSAKRGSPVFKSTNGGGSWAASNAGLNASTVYAFAVDPSTPTTVYAATELGLYKSTDGGNNWSSLKQGLPPETPIAQVVVDRVNPATLYAAAANYAGVYKSTDGGNNWTKLANLPEEDYTALAIDPVNTQTLYAGNYGGNRVLFKSTDGGASWNPIDAANMTRSVVLSIVIDPLNPANIYVGTRGNLFRSQNGGASWNNPVNINGSGAWIEGLAIDPATPSTLYAATDGGIFKSTNSGQTWNTIGSNLPSSFFFSKSIIVDPTNSSTIYAGTFGQDIAKSTDGGNTWSSVKLSLDPNAEIVLAINPSNTSILYAGGYSGSDALLLKLNPSGTAAVYSTFLGGDAGDTAFGVAADSAGNAYVTGSTYSSNFPLANALQGFHATPILESFPPSDAFVAKLNPAGSSLVYSTYLGGGDSETGSAIAVDSSGNAYVTGKTFSSDFPTVNALQETCGSCYLGGGDDAFVTKLNPSGSAFLYSTYFGGNDTDWAHGIAVDAAGNAYITGETDSYNLLILGGAPQTTYHQATDAFAAKLNPAGSSLVYSTYLGGSREDYGYGIGVGPDGSVYITGYTISTNFPIAAALQPNSGTFGDAFVTRIGPSDSSGASADLSLTLTDSPDPADAPQDVTYTVTVTNNGPSTATGVLLHDTVPVGVPLVSTTPSQGSCTQPSAGIFACNLGNIASGAQATVVIVVRPEYASTISNSASVGANEPDPNTGNNSATQTTTVTFTPRFMIAGRIRTASGISPGGVTVTLSGSQSATMITDLIGNYAFTGLASGGNYTVTPSRPNFTFSPPNAVFNNLSQDMTGVNFDGTATAPTLQLNQSSYSIAEGTGSLDLLVNRSGNPSTPVTVNYTTTDAAAFLQNCNVTNSAATSRCDYVGVLGTLHFAAGETSKTISIPVVDDVYLEGPESFFITLSNPTGGAVLGSQPRSTIQITDNSNDVSGAANPIDQPQFFVRQHYIDFLSREPDPLSAGWVTILNGCAAGDQSCRLSVSQGIYGSPEFRDRGYFIYKFYSVSLGRKPGYDEFNLDRARVSGFQTDAELEQSKVDFIADFMARSEFTSIYTGLTNNAYVQRLYDTAGVSQVTVNGTVLNVGAMQQSMTQGKTRAVVLREIAESAEVSARFNTESTVVMHYFGYLRRDPDAQYQQWINILNSTGDSRNVTSGFINSPEYRARFGQ